MKTSFKAAALVLSMIAGSAFAATDLSGFSDLAGAGGKIDSLGTIGTTASTTAVAGDENFALVAQFGSVGNNASVDQSGALGNVAVVLQSSATNLNTAAVVQNGTMNIAKINQR